VALVLGGGAGAAARAMSESQAAAGRFSMATLLPEHKAVVRRAWAKSAEDLDTTAAPRSDWRQRSGQVHGAKPLVRQSGATRHPLAPVDVGHSKRVPRPGYTPVWVGRGAAPRRLGTRSCCRVTGGPRRREPRRLSATRRATRTPRCCATSPATTVRWRGWRAAWRWRESAGRRRSGRPSWRSSRRGFSAASGSS